MSDQEHKSLEPIWTTHQPDLDVFPPPRSHSGLPTPVYHSTTPYGSGSHAGQAQSLPTLANTSIYGDARSHHSTVAHSVGSGQGHGARMGRDVIGQDATFEHRDSVVMPSSSVKSDTMASLQASDDERDEDEDEDDESSDSDQGHEEGDLKQLTAAEIRQQKRKMKRFRLTHTQARFLMGEFARDAHPDAAYREKLSQNIPGLSPRQVQVWFQNRRAKLKRMSAEDRDRMMRSRALPEHFGMTQTTNQAFMHGAAATQDSGPRLLQTPHLSRYGDVRPLTLDTAGRSGQIESSFTSPTSVTPALGAFSFTPPHSATETHSPMSGGGEYGPFGYRSIASSPRRSLLSPGHSSTASNSSSLPSTLMRIPALDRPRQSSVDIHSSGFRPALASYPGVQASPSLLQQNDRRGSAPQPRPASHRDMAPPNTPIGLGFSFDSVSNYQQPHLSTNASHLMYGSSGIGTSSAAPTGSYPAYLDYSGNTGNASGSSHYSSQQTSHYQPTFGSQYASQLQNNAMEQAPSSVQHFPSFPSPSPHYGQQTRQDSFSKRDETEPGPNDSRPVTGHHSY